MKSLRIEFKSRIPAKKNSVVITRYGKRPSKAYEKWQKKELASLAGTPRIPGPVVIDYQFWIGGTVSPATFDLDNIVASINDILQDAGVIDGDSWDLLPRPDARLMGFTRGEQTVIVTIKQVDAPWVPLLAALRDKAQIKALAARAGVSQKEVVNRIWDKLERLDVAL